VAEIAPLASRFEGVSFKLPVEVSARRHTTVGTLVATRPHAAASLWARIDRKLVDRAVWVPLINEHGIDFVSARVRNYQFHPTGASSPTSCGFADRRCGHPV
jgi:hypothetical protein